LQASRMEIRIDDIIDEKIKTYVIIHTNAERIMMPRRRWYQVPITKLPDPSIEILLAYESMLINDDILFKLVISLFKFLFYIKIINIILYFRIGL
jgi:hypothetical protein